MVHKEVACTASKVLNVAFNSDLIEGQTQSYRLEHTAEGVFRLLMQWMYFQKLVLPVLDRLIGGDPSVEGVADEKTALAKLWVLADELGIPCLQNVALKARNDLSLKANTGTMSYSQWIYDNTGPDSALRRYTIASLATINVDNFPSFADDIPKEMWVDFGMYMLRREKGLEKKNPKVSDYYVKED